MQDSQVRGRYCATRSEEKRSADRDRERFIRVCMDFVRDGEKCSELRELRRTLDEILSVAASAVMEVTDREGPRAFWFRILDGCGNAPSGFTPGKQLLSDDIAFTLRAIEALQSAKLSHAQLCVRAPSCVVMIAGGYQTLRRMKKLWRCYAMFMTGGHIRRYDLPSFRHFVCCVFFILYFIYKKTSRDFGPHAKAVAVLGRICTETILSEEM